jgi:hypothetical protein
VDAARGPFAAVTRARPASVATTHAPASPGGSVGELSVIVIASMPTINGTAHNVHTFHPLAGHSR